MTEMKLILLFITIVFCSDLYAISNRLHQHMVAKETFFNWHFFENGRGMTISPDIVRFLWMIQRENALESKSAVNELIHKRYGFNFREDKILGVFDVPYQDMRVGVLGCTGCHSGKAAGVLIPGLGNKTMDAHLVGKDTGRIQRFWGQRQNNPSYRYIHSKAMNFAKVLSDTNIANHTRGVVSDAVITTFFYKDHQRPYPKNLSKALVKIPHLWGIKEKRPMGVFNDGSLDGENYAWIFGAELMASDSGEHLRAVLPKIKWLTDEVLGNLLPPPYPFEVDKNLAKTGEKLFQKNCMGCHGRHQRDQNGFALYHAPKVIDIDKVDTDRDKLHHINDEFIELVETGSLSDLLSFKRENVQKGYFAPNLWGIWSRFPYLHNGSVPTLYHMMLPKHERPEVFSMLEAGEEKRFDKVRVGLTLPKKSGYARTLRSAKAGNRNLYYVNREGLSNKGHYFNKFKNLDHKSRLSIIEYLKTL